MATLVHTGSVFSSTNAASLTVDSPSASAGNVLVLQVHWIDTGGTNSVTPAAISGWSDGYRVASCASSTGFRSGYTVYYKTAAGGVESPVFASPSSGSLYSRGIITEWSGMGALDSASTSATTTNSVAASTTGTTVPNTGTLASANSTVFTGCTLSCATGLSNAALAFSGGSWNTAILSNQDTSTSVGALASWKTVSATTALGATYTWTSDSSMQNFQAAVTVFSDSVAGGVPPTSKLAMLGIG